MKTTEANCIADPVSDANCHHCSHCLLDRVRKAGAKRLGRKLELGTAGTCLFSWLQRQPCNSHNITMMEPQHNFTAAAAGLHARSSYRHTTHRSRDMHMHSAANWPQQLHNCAAVIVYRTWGREKPDWNCHLVNFPTPIMTNYVTLDKLEPQPKE